jgi:hypothetical protein
MQETLIRTQPRRTSTTRARRRRLVRSAGAQRDESAQARTHGVVPVARDSLKVMARRSRSRSIQEAIHPASCRCTTTNEFRKGQSVPWPLRSPLLRKLAVHARKKARRGKMACGDGVTAICLSGLATAIAKPETSPGAAMELTVSKVPLTAD